MCAGRRVRGEGASPPNVDVMQSKIGDENMEKVKERAECILSQRHSKEESSVGFIA